MKAVNKGFTLIELMIVVAVIGVLAAIAIPQYQKYVAKSEFAAAYASLAAAKTNLDDYVISNGTFPTGVSQIGLSASAAMGTIGLGTSAITYNITKGSPDASGKTVQLVRGTEGWSCKVTVSPDQALLPKGCISAAN